MCKKGRTVWFIRRQNAIKYIYTIGFPYNSNSQLGNGESILFISHKTYKISRHKLSKNVKVLYK